MTSNENSKDEKLQHNINRDSTKILALSSDKID